MPEKFSPTMAEKESYFENDEQSSGSTSSASSLKSVREVMVPSISHARSTREKYVR